MFELDPAAPNVTASRYRQVSVAVVDSLDPDRLVAHFTGREAYFRTRFVVARRRDQSDRVALVELARDGSAELFSPAPAARVLAGAEECAYVRDDQADPGIASHLAAAAQRHPSARCVVVEGRYSHVSFILNPDPIEVTVVDVVPPVPSKLADQVRRVLDSTEELPPVIVTERIIDSRELLAEASQRSPDGGGSPRAAPSAVASTPGRGQPPESGGGPQQVLVPCRGGGVDIDGAAVSYLDQRPEQTEPWTLLGCERSRQIHDWFYGTAPTEVVDWCPRRFVGPAARCPDGTDTPDSADRSAVADLPAADPPDSADQPPGPTAAAGLAINPDDLVLSRCCLLEEGVERRGGAVWVPWGATLAEVRRAVELLVDERAGSWTRT